jgi:hypothetical protein
LALIFVIPDGAKAPIRNPDANAKLSGFRVRASRAPE